MKKNYLVLLPAFLVALSSFCSPCKECILWEGGLTKRCIKTIRLNSDVIVGQRTGENTAQLSIGKSGIQQNLLTAIAELNGLVVTDDPVSIQINKVTAYLIFSVNNATGKKITVALELVQNSTDLIFRSKSGREMHICKSNGSCNSCEFVFDAIRIIACTCNSGNVDSAVSNCQHRGIISK